MHIYIYITGKPTLKYYYFIIINLDIDIIYVENIN